MDWIEQHLLTLVIFLPVAGAIFLALMPAAQHVSIRRAALAISVATLILVLAVMGRFLQESAYVSAGEFVLEERADWISWPTIEPEDLARGDQPTVQIQYALGLDGISLPLLALTALLTPLAILASFSGIRERVKEYYALILLLHGAMLGVFCARDLLLFYIFFEFTLIPLYFIIAIWGGSERRKAANMFFLYTLAGSLLTLAGVLYLGWLGYQHTRAAGLPFSFDLERLNELAAAGVLPVSVQKWLFMAFFAGFAIKVPLFPVHTWLPLAHTEAPTAGSAILAGVLLKLGTYGFLRINLPMLPDASVQLAPFIAWLAIIGIIYGALAAWAQRDVKKLVAYSSVSHLGFCMLGMFALNMSGLTGSLLYMVNHGLSTAALFFVVGMMYERYHTRQLDQIGGLARKMPRMAFFLIVFTLASIGLPGLNGFVSEFLVLLCAFPSGGSNGPLGVAYAAFAATGVILSAVYMLHMARGVLFGPVKEPGHGFDSSTRLKQDLTRAELWVLTPIAVLCLALGVFPKPVLDVVQPALERQALAPVRSSDAWAARQVDHQQMTRDQDQARNPKSEIRDNIQNRNIQMSETSRRAPSGFGPSVISHFEIVSDFVLRVSDLRGQRGAP